MSAGDWSISQSIWTALSRQHFIRTFDFKCITKILPPAEAASDGIREDISQRLQFMEFYFSQIGSVFYEGRERENRPSQLCEQNWRFFLRHLKLSPPFKRLCPFWFHYRLHSKTRTCMKYVEVKGGISGILRDTRHKFGIRCGQLIQYLLASAVYSECICASEKHLAVSTKIVLFSSKAFKIFKLLCWGWRFQMSDYY